MDGGRRHCFAMRRDPRPPKHKLKNWRQRLAMHFHTCSYESPSTRPTCTHSRSDLYSLDLMCKTQGERERERERESEREREREK